MCIVNCTFLLNAVIRAFQLNSNERRCAACGCPLTTCKQSWPVGRGRLYLCEDSPRKDVARFLSGLLVTDGWDHRLVGCLVFDPRTNNGSKYITLSLGGKMVPLERTEFRQEQKYHSIVLAAIAKASHLDGTKANPMEKAAMRRFFLGYDPLAPKEETFIEKVLSKMGFGPQALAV
jgi:hypothetical protein